MGFLQQFHLVIKYKKGIHNKVADMLSRPPMNASIILQNSSLTHESYLEQCAEDKYFKKAYASLTHGKQEENYFVHDQLLLISSCIISVNSVFQRKKECM